LNRSSFINLHLLPEVPDRITGNDANPCIMYDLLYCNVIGFTPNSSLAKYASCAASQASSQFTHFQVCSLFGLPMKVLPRCLKARVVANKIFEQQYNMLL
jgi:hypothetical protein